MLFKNVLRTLKKQYVQLFLLGIIITLSSFIYTTMDYSISGVLAPTETYFEESNQEDFAIGMLDILLEDDVQFMMDQCPSFLLLAPTSWPFTVSGVKEIDPTCYYGILERRVATIEATYDNINLEVRESKDVFFTSNDKSFRIRVLKGMDEINTSYLVEGEAPQTTSEIAVSNTFALKNDLDIGDTFTMKDKDYTVSGYVLFPDYSLSLLGTELILDNSTQTLALVVDDEFEALDEIVAFEIAGDLLQGFTDKEFTTSVIKDVRNQPQLDFVTNVVLTANNLRSGGIYADLAGGKAQGVLLSLLIASIALMIVGIMVSRVLHSQRGPIGILMSMGYTNNQITYPYIFFIIIMSLPAILLGYFLGVYAAEPLMMMYKEFYLLPNQPIQQTGLTIFVAVVLPFTFIVGLSFLIVRNLLNQKPVTLLNPEVTSSSNFLTKRVSKYIKNFKITTKLQHLLLYRSIIKFSVYLIGMFFAAFLILFSFSMNRIFDRMLYDYYESTSHNYVGYCNYEGPCLVNDQQNPVIELPSVIVNDEDASVYGLDQEEPQLHPIFNKKGEDITYELNNGIIITQSIKLTRGYDIGDTLEIVVGDKTISMKVVGISEEYTGNKMYVDREILSEALTNTPDYYNAVYSTTELTRDDYLVVVNIQDIIDQADSMQQFFTVMIGLMVGISIAIGAIIVYILTVMTIEDNFYNISLFKVIGYNDKEINKMILGGYTLYGVLIFISCIPLALVSFWGIEVFLAQYYDMLFPLRFVWWHAIASILIFYIIFNVAALNAKRNLTKVSLQEAMKMYQV